MSYGMGKGRFRKPKMRNEGKSRVNIQEEGIRFTKKDDISVSNEADPPTDIADFTGTSRAAIEAKKFIKASTH